MFVSLADVCVLVFRFLVIRSGLLCDSEIYLPHASLIKERYYDENRNIVGRK